MRGGVPSFKHYNSRGDVVAATYGNSSLTYQAAYEAFGRYGDNRSARKFYHQQLDEIAGKLDSSAPIRDQARQAFDLRNQAKRDTRDLMADRDAAAMLDRNSALPTWDDMVQRAADKGLEGDDVYKYIRDASSRSNKSVDESLNLARKINKDDE